MPRSRAVRQRSTVFARDLLRQRKAQAAALGAARDQRQEQLLGHVLGHAVAVVDDFDAHRQGRNVIGSRVRSGIAAQARRVLGAGAQGDGGGAGLDRIAYQVPHRLHQPVGIPGQLRQARVVVAHQPHRPSGVAFGQPQHALEHAVDVEWHVRAWRRRCEQLVDQRRQPRDLVIDQRHQRPGVRIGVHAARQQLRGALEAGQRIAQLVRQPAQRRRQRGGQQPGRVVAGELVDRVRFDDYAIVLRRPPEIGKARGPGRMAQAHAAQADVTVRAARGSRGTGIVFVERGPAHADQPAHTDAQPAPERGIGRGDDAGRIEPRDGRREGIGKGGQVGHAPS